MYQRDVMYYRFITLTDITAGVIKYHIAFHTIPGFLPTITLISLQKRSSPDETIKQTYTICHNKLKLLFSSDNKLKWKIIVLRTREIVIADTYFMSV